MALELSLKSIFLTLKLSLSESTKEPLSAAAICGTMLAYIYFEPYRL